ncbi:MAG: hypothetical protein ACRDDY_17530 [Clostridium sp.]|uniref:hypothetical protein n=1 Tax=Clostridium sp. TaxID=1506 RepID=UPI003EE802DD
MEFLNKQHEERFLYMENKSGKTLKNKEYELLYFIISGNEGLWNKKDIILSEDFDELIIDLTLDKNRCVDSEKLNNSERKLLNLGINMFNIRLAKMPLAEIMYDLDSLDQRLAFNLIKFKYNM